MWGSGYDSFGAVEQTLAGEHGRNPERRKVANNTYLERRDSESIALRLHATDILVFRPESVEYATGGWYSVTTKARLNDFAPLRVYSDRGTWFLYRGGNKVARFFDGIRVSYAGDVLNGESIEETERKANERKATERGISRYVKLVSATFSAGMPQPSAADCFYCVMRETETGKPLGDVTGDSFHIREHIREGYVVPSLLVNAIVERGYPIPAIILNVREDGTMGGERGFADNVSRAVRQYLRKRLLTEN